MAVIHISGRPYEIVQEHRTAWNLEMFRDRYSEVLDRYDYIVGDWGYNQLRLKGFFKENHPKSTRDTAMSSVMDYINEYCNFGCAYFILEKQPAKEGRVRTPEGWESDAEMEGAASAEEWSEQENGSSQGISLVPKQAPSDDLEDASNAEQEERPQTRAERHRRIERQFRTERAERSEKQPERNGRPNRQDRQARGEQERGSRPERPERNDRGERNTRNDRNERGNRNERKDGAERNERDRPEGQERNKSNRQQRNRYHKSSKPANGKAPSGGNREAVVSRATEEVRS